MISRGRGSEQNVLWLRERHGDAFQLIVRSVADADACVRAVDDAEIVYHFAGQVAVTTSVTDPRHDFEVNALGTFNILEAARTSSHNPIVLYSSTNKVYGELDGVEVVEQDDRYALPTCLWVFPKPSRWIFIPPTAVPRDRQTSMSATMPGYMAFPRSCFDSRAFMASGRWEWRIRAGLRGSLSRR